MSVAANPGRGQDAPHSDARVIFGFPGDLATKLQPLSAVALAARVKRPGSWGPATADALIADDGGWHNPTAEDEHAPGVTGALR